MKDKRWVRMLLTLVFCLVFLAVPSENGWAMPFNHAVGYDVGAAPLSVAVGDFDGDGIPDLAVANYNSENVSILLAAAAPPVTPVTPPAAGTAYPVWAVLLAGIVGGIGLLMLRRRSRVRESVGRSDHTFT